MKRDAKMQCYLDDSRGIYIPQAFAQITKRECVLNVRDEDWETLLAGPDHEWYWEAWSAVCDQALIVDPTTGEQWTIYQDGDCFLIEEGAEYDETREDCQWFIDDGEPDDSSEEENSK